jgi:hypothetical protein
MKLIFYAAPHFDINMSVVMKANIFFTIPELKFPMVIVQSLPRGISDHTPLLLDTGSPSQPNKCMFKFELAWLFKDGFHEKVAEVWQWETKGSNSLERWQNKIRSLQRYLRGWAKNMNGLCQHHVIRYLK